MSVGKKERRGKKIIFHIFDYFVVALIVVYVRFSYHAHHMNPIETKRKKEKIEDVSSFILNKRRDLL